MIVQPGKGDLLFHSRVMHLVVSLAHGGLERLVVDWTNERNREWPESTRICCLDQPGDLACEVEGAAMVCLKAKRARKPFDLAVVLRLRREILAAKRRKRHKRDVDSREGPGARETDNDSRLTSSRGLRSKVDSPRSSLVVHSHNLAAWQYAALACMGTGVRHVHTEHGTNPHSVGRINRWRTRWLVKCTDQLVAVSENTADALVQEHGIRRSDICVIRNGVRVGEMEKVEHKGAKIAKGERLSADRHRFPQVSDDAHVIGSVGRLAHVKGYDRLIRAFAGLGDVSGIVANTSHKNSSDGCLNGEVQGLMSPFLLLIGDGPERENLEALAQELGVSDHVIFAGYQPHVSECLAAMDLFVLPSRSEGLSVSLLEAMAAGVPVAVTDVSENRQVLDGGRCGVLLPDDESEWSSVLVEMIRDVGCGMWGEKAENARNRVMQHYSQDATLDQHETLYQELATIND